MRGSKLLGDIRVGCWFSWDRGLGTLGVGCNSFVSVVGTELMNDRAERCWSDHQVSQVKALGFNPEGNESP